VQPIPAKDYATPTPRPANSALDCGKIARVYGIVARPWQTALSACLDELIVPAPAEAK
jgi:dTDP-4-dehydrorhamnose reductase